MSMGFGGGGQSRMPDVPPAPKAEVTKPVTEAAMAARDDQKRRAARAAGLQSTILTGNTVGGKTLLGQ